MPKLKTNKHRTLVAFPGPDIPAERLCTETFENYINQREEQLNVSGENIEELTESFKNRISEPLHKLNSSIEMGEYFVVPVKEIKEMLNNGDDPEFVKVCNALRNVTDAAGQVKTFPVAILIPVKKVMSEDVFRFEVCKEEHSVYIEAYPCPPHPSCPIRPGGNPFRNIFKETMKFNQFNGII